MEIVHHGKVTGKHAKDLQEYRPKFSIRMHHDVKIVLRVVHSTCTMAMKIATFWV